LIGVLPHNSNHTID
jgi:hypothetical protein